ncbi:MAG: hypothetical protein L0H64_15685 [Pseudonocardia sp.]|nr:hypothetical protein [Pseudonocardia sp.]
MAEIRIDATDVVVRLTRLEKVAALRGDVRVPRDAVRAVEQVAAGDALAAVRGFRAPGLHVPGLTKIGTWRRAGGRVFAVVAGRRTAVRIVLAGARYREIVVSTPDAAAVAAALR